MDTPIDEPKGYELKTQIIFEKNLHYKSLKSYASNLERYLQRVVENLRKSKNTGINNLGVAIELDVKNIQIKYLKELLQQVNTNQLLDK